MHTFLIHPHQYLVSVCVRFAMNDDRSTTESHPEGNTILYLTRKEEKNRWRYHVQRLNWARRNNDSEFRSNEQWIMTECVWISYAAWWIPMEPARVCPLLEWQCLSLSCKWGHISHWLKMLYDHRHRLHCTWQPTYIAVRMVRKIYWLSDPLKQFLLVACFVFLYYLSEHDLTMIKCWHQRHSTLIYIYDPTNDGQITLWTNSCHISFIR